MSREQLQDGYLWRYDELYASDKLLERLERAWKTRRKPRRPLAEHLFLGAALGAQALRSRDAAFRSVTRGGLKLMGNRRLPTAPGQLLISLDSAEYAGFLRRYRSPDYAAHVRQFEASDGGPVRDGGVELGVNQWDTERARRGSARLGAG